jgi:SAM-dependent methyltransferase
VSGLRVLELGCGSGPLTQWLIDQDAKVTAAEISPAMLALAEQRVGSRARLIEADLGAGLSFAADASFDVVVASLMMHYLRDWEALLAEAGRVLVDSGRFVFSTHHPTMDARIHSPEDYFAIKEVTEEWHEGCPVSFWRRPLTAMTEAIAKTGFVITRLEEPFPLPALEQADPSAYHRLRTQPAFLFFELMRGPRGSRGGVP